MRSRTSGSYLSQNDYQSFCSAEWPSAFFLRERTKCGVEPPVLTSHKTIINRFARQSGHRHFFCEKGLNAESNLRFLPLAKRLSIVLLGRVTIGIFFAKNNKNKFFTQKQKIFLPFFYL